MTIFFTKVFYYLTRYSINLGIGALMLPRIYNIVEGRQVSFDLKNCLCDYQFFTIIIKITTITHFFLSVAFIYC